LHLVDFKYASNFGEAQGPDSIFGRHREFTDFDPPGFSNMPGELNGHEPHGINEIGQIVGYFRATDGRLHGYPLNPDENVGGDHQ